MWKADIDSAYRRVPVKMEHRPFAAITFVRNGTTVVSVHNALPFGSVASVHGWDRIGANLFVSRRIPIVCMHCLALSLLEKIAIVLLRLPVDRYCDDFFSCDRRASAAHGMNIFARHARHLVVAWCMPSKSSQRCQVYHAVPRRGRRRPTQIGSGDAPHDFGG